MYLTHDSLVLDVENHLLGSPHALGKRHPHNTMGYFMDSDHTHIKIQWVTQIYFLSLWLLVMLFLLI